MRSLLALFTILLTISAGCVDSAADLAPAAAPTPEAAEDTSTTPAPEGGSTNDASPENETAPEERTNTSTQQEADAAAAEPPAPVEPVERIVESTYTADVFTGRPCPDAASPATPAMCTSTVNEAAATLGETLGALSATWTATWSGAAPEDATLRIVLVREGVEIANVTGARTIDGTLDASALGAGEITATVLADAPVAAHDFVVKFTLRTLVMPE